MHDFIEGRLPEYYRERRKRDAVGLEDNHEQHIVHGDAEAKAAATAWQNALAEKGWVAPH